MKVSETALNTCVFTIRLESRTAPEFIDVTRRVSELLKESRIKNGMALVFSKHTTAAITIQENEPLLLNDMASLLERLAPRNARYGHNDFGIRTVHMEEDECPNGTLTLPAPYPQQQRDDPCNRRRACPRPVSARLCRRARREQGGPSRDSRTDHGGVNGTEMNLLLTGTSPSYTVDEAFAQCAELANTHYENFTVGSWLLPREKRHHIYSIYAFCRSVDDLGDRYPGDRLSALDAWELDLERCYDARPRHPYLIALQHTIRQFDIPSEPFVKLIEANRMDQTTTRHATYDDLEYYCQHSANPVGRLVLYVFGYRDEERQRLSDYTCTALQLANFWQDVARDYAMGRIYIPLEDMERFGYSEDQLARGLCSTQFRDLMAFEVARARRLFRSGLKLVDTLDGRLKLDVALFSLSGLKVLDAIERQSYDVLSRRPTLSSGTKLGLMLGTILKLKLFGRI